MITDSPMMLSVLTGILGYVARRDFIDALTIGSVSYLYYKNYGFTARGIEDGINVVKNSYK